MTAGLIFAAGLGTRLAPITDTMPKALIPVGGEPMLGRVIQRLKNAGITRIAVNVHHHADQVEDYLRNNNNFGIEIRISDERDLLLDTGGGLLRAFEILGEDVDDILVHNADILTDVSLKDIIEYHETASADVTMLVKERPSGRLLYFSNDDNMLKGWKNIVTGQTLPKGFNPDAFENLTAKAFCGIHLVSRSVLPSLRKFSKEKVFPVVPFYVENCHTLKILGFTPKNTFTWFDIGSPEKLETARAAEKQMQLDRRYLRMAGIWSENSYCKRRQVGAIIVKDKMIISDGFNGTPAGFENVCEDETGVTKPYVLHAEANAITKVARSNNSSDGSTLYVTASPCLECAKLIIQSGIKRVVYGELYRLCDGIELMERAGIECSYLPLNNL